jgi:3-hydroxyisobutyrate dehydrogenase-like beta-hydroxyacid dehydrogenase
MSIGQVTRDDRVGVIGLGRIGGGIAERLCDAGWKVSVYDLRADAAQRFRERAQVALDSAELARTCACVLIAVYDADQLDEVMAGPAGMLSAGVGGLSVLVLSTVPHRRLLAAAEQAAAVGITLLDCGVTPGFAASTGELVTFVGGLDAAVDRVRPVLETISKLPLHMGPLGAGMQAKIANNVCTYVTMLGMWQARELAERGGLDLAKLAEGVAASALMTKGHTAMLLAASRPETSRRYTADVLHKDLAAARELAGELGVDIPAIELADSIRNRIAAVEEPNR